MKSASRWARRLASLVLMCLLSLAVSGCEDPREITVHEPGVYKGTVDPLLTLQATPEYEQRLAARFDYQRDR